MAASGGMDPDVAMASGSSTGHSNQYVTLTTAWPSDTHMVSCGSQNTEIQMAFGGNSSHGH